MARLRTVDDELYNFGTGKNEINLDLAPIFTLSNKLRQSAEPIVVSHEVEVDGKRVLSKIVVAARAGMYPTAKDRDVWLALMRMGQEQGWPEEIRFSTLELCIRSNLDGDGYGYRRVREALKRLAGVQVYFENCYNYKADKKSGTRPHQDFSVTSLIQNASLSSQRGPNVGGSVIINTGLLRSIKAGYVWSPDLNIYHHHLKSAHAKALYMVIGPRGYMAAKKENGRFEIALSLLRQRMSFPKETRPSRAIKEIEDAAEQLINVGVLVDCVKRNNRRRGEVFTFVFPVSGEHRPGQASGHSRPTEELRISEPTARPEEATKGGSLPLEEARRILGIEKAEEIEIAVKRSFANARNQDPDREVSSMKIQAEVRIAICNAARQVMETSGK